LGIKILDLPHLLFHQNLRAALDELDQLDIISFLNLLDEGFWVKATLYTLLDTEQEGSGPQELR